MHLIGVPGYGDRPTSLLNSYVATPETMRVLIVDAGPTGLTAADELARQGIAGDVIDRKEEPSSLSCAVGIMPSSLKTLTPSGVTDKLFAKRPRSGLVIRHRLRKL